MNVCLTCGLIGDISLFSKQRASRKTTVGTKCKKCTALVNHQWYLKNKVHCKQRYQAAVKKYPERYRKASLNYYHRNKIKCRLSNRNWIRKNLKYVAKKMRDKRSDIQFLLRSRLRSRIHCALKRAGTYKRNGTLELLGCNKEQLKAHIQSLFVKGMSWANIGLWHIDHKKPLASFDLTDKAQLAIAFHYSNIQPLWASQNLAKGDRV